MNEIEIPVWVLWLFFSAVWIMVVRIVFKNDKD